MPPPRNSSGVESFDVEEMFEMSMGKRTLPEREAVEVVERKEEEEEEDQEEKGYLPTQMKK